MRQSQVFMVCSRPDPQFRCVLAIRQCYNASIFQSTDDLYGHEAFQPDYDPATKSSPMTIDVARRYRISDAGSAFLRIEMLRRKGP